MTAPTDLRREAPPPVREIDSPESAELRDAGAIFVDVREPGEWDTGIIPGAELILGRELAGRIGAAVPDPATPIVIYCASGVRSIASARTLMGLGYTNVASMRGGIVGWRRAGLPVAPRPLESDAAGVGAATGLTPAQRERYSRHLLMPEVGPEGQARLLASRVVIVGAGGLGSPAALYLAAAGVGTLEIVDDDIVDVSNLQRQVLHATDRVGLAKVESARRTIEALNPDVSVVTRAERLGPDNVASLIAGCDVVIDGTDTFETRYLLNDAAVAARIPVVHASVYRFEGQLTTFVPFEGPCYRCLYPAPPPHELAPPCSVAGVLGVVPGILGLLQANEALKLILGIGEPLVGRLLTFDALEGSFLELGLERDPECPVCSDAAVAAAGGAAPRDAASPA